MTSYLRYKQQIRTVQDADDAEIESWITVRGNHIPIRKGQSKEEAVKSFVESKGGNSSETGSSVPEDYKKSVAHYTPEKHAEAANFYGEKMASVQKKANNENDPNVDIHRKHFEEYQTLSNWHAEQAKKANEFVNGTLIDKRNLPAGTKWSPTDIYGNGTGNKKEEKSKYNIQHGAKISDIESMINAHADKKAYKSWKEEEEYVAEKLKEEGIYAYGNQIKEAMKNVYGDVYTQERKEESSKKDTSSIIKQSKVEMTNGLKHITHTTPDGYKFSVWESSNDPGWKTNNLPADYFKTESEATEAATKQFKKDLEYYNSEKANKKGKQLFEEKYGTKKTESKESKQPADIMDWKFEDVMKLPVSDPRVHKYIAKNNWLKTSTVATIAEAFGNTEDLYMEIDRMSNAKGYGWDKIKWGKK